MAKARRSQRPSQCSEPASERNACELGRSRDPRGPRHCGIRTLHKSVPNGRERSPIKRDTSAYGSHASYRCTTSHTRTTRDGSGSAGYKHDYPVASTDSCAADVTHRRAGAARIRTDGEVPRRVLQLQRKSSRDLLTSWWRRHLVSVKALNAVARSRLAISRLPNPTRGLSQQSQISPAEPDGLLQGEAVGVVSISTGRVCD